MVGNFVLIYMYNYIDFCIFCCLYNFYRDIEIVVSDINEYQNFIYQIYLFDILQVFNF